MKGWLDFSARYQGKSIRAEHNFDKLTRSVLILWVLSICLIVTVIVGGLGTGYCGYKLYRKVQGQADTIELSREGINTLEICMEELSHRLMMKLRHFSLIVMTTTITFFL